MKKLKPKEGPVCACGKEDLYEAWLQQQEPGKEEALTKVPPKTASVISGTDQLISEQKIGYQP